MKYQWILFDADGTLFDFDQAADQALKNSFKQYDIPFDPAYIPLYLSINKTVWRQYERGEIQADELKPLRFQRLFEQLGHTVDPHRFSNDYLDHLADGSMLLDGAEKLVLALHGKVRMMILTNGFARVQRPRLSRSNIQHYFEDIVISDEVGVAKPEPRIFDIAFEKMGLPPREQVLIVGDNLGSDIKGGIDYGIDTCWYNAKGQADPAGMNFTYEVSHLREIPGILR